MVPSIPRSYKCAPSVWGHSRDCVPIRSGFAAANSMLRQNLYDGVDHSQIDPSPKVTEGLNLDTDPDNIRYTMDYVSDLPLIDPHSMLSQQRARFPRWGCPCTAHRQSQRHSLHSSHPSPPVAHGIMEVPASSPVQVSSLQAPAASYGRIVAS